MRIMHYFILHSAREGERECEWDSGRTKDEGKNTVIICFMALGAEIFFFFFVPVRSYIAVGVFSCVSMCWLWADAWWLLFFSPVLRFTSNKTSGNQVWKENLYVKRTSVCHIRAQHRVGNGRKFIWSYVVCCRVVYVSFLNPCAILSATSMVTLSSRVRVWHLRSTVFVSWTFHMCSDVTRMK